MRKLRLREVTWGAQGRAALFGHGQPGLGPGILRHWQLYSHIWDEPFLFFFLIIIVQWVILLLPGDIWLCLETFFFGHSREREKVLVASRRERSGMLLHTLRRTGPPRFAEELSGSCVGSAETEKSSQPLTPVEGSVFFQTFPSDYNSIHSHMCISQKNNQMCSMGCLYGQLYTHFRMGVYFDNCSFPVVGWTDAKDGSFYNFYRQ